MPDANPLPDGKRVKAFRAVEAILREDPVLAGYVNRFQSWEGDRADTLEPTPAMMPMIRLSPKVFPNVPTTQGTITAVLGVRVQIFVAGTNSDHLLNFWDAIEDAMVDRKPFRAGTVGCYLTDQLGGAVAIVQDPGFNAWETKDPDPLSYLSGDGIITVSFRRRR